MHKVGNFDIFKEYDFFEVNMFDVIITKNCIKPTEDIVKEMFAKNHAINTTDIKLEKSSGILKFTGCENKRLFHK